MAESTAVRPVSRRSLMAWEAFRARVKELGGRVVEEAWRGVGERHEIRCKEGHTSYPYPNRVAQGVGICRVCAGLDPATAERHLRERLTAAGAVLLDPYQGAHRRVRVRCAGGHEITGKPAHLVRVGVLCSVCVGRDGVSLLAAFRARVEAQGGILLATSWLGTHHPHDALCKEGHLCTPRPSGLLSDKSICRICACRDPHVVEERFRERVAELGGVVLGTWETIHVPILIRCERGHETKPIPNHVVRGGGICRHCKGKAWDVFYVVRDDLNDLIKVGITSGNPAARLRYHERDGFEEVVRLVTGLPGSTAPDLERQVLNALKDARQEPVRGREYFAARVLDVVLDLVDNHPDVRT